jgi:hypothetical protein
MKSPVATLVGLALLVAACTSMIVTPTPPAPSPGASLVPSQPSAPPSIAALAPCSVDQLNVTAGHAGGAAGTNYLAVFVELARGPACSIRDTPTVTIVGPDAAVLATSGDGPSKPFPLTFIDLYQIGWSADCRTFPSGDLTARIAFSPTVVVALPIGQFRPSHCMQPSGQALFMSAVQPPE